jgi:hypothetical protein
VFLASGRLAGPTVDLRRLIGLKRGQILCAPAAANGERRGARWQSPALFLIVIVVRD